MDVRQIEFFLAVVEERSFTRAAEASHVSQPGLSSSIRSLERELRVRLFERSPRGVSLTPSGEAFLPRARRMLDDARAVRQEVLEASGEVRGSLRLGAEQCLGDLVDLPDLLATFHGRHPGVTLSMVQAGTGSLLDAVRRGELDVALVGTPVDADATLAGLETVDLALHGFELLAAPDHAVAATGCVCLTDLTSTEFVDLDVAWGARRVVDAVFAGRGLERRIAFTVNDVHLLIDLVRQGLAVALVPASVGEKPQAAGLSRLPLDDAVLRWSVRAVVAPGAGNAGRLFADMLVPTAAMDDGPAVEDAPAVGDAVVAGR
ncbi:LysR family transcriptional regulator [Xylanimonas oleitrophica]|nr:LysR family transcriptional regulator [Xylanimonas oleitrophica]